MLVTKFDIQIGRFKFDFCAGVEITSTWENLTDTATISIPKRLRFKKNGEFTDEITSGPDALWKRGDKVTVSLGYDTDVTQRFLGVITKIKPKLPLEFSCEDAMYILKQNTIKTYYKSSVRLPELVRAIVPESITTEVEDIKLGKFKIENATTAEVLDYLKKTFGLYSRFQPDGSLYVGFPYKVSKISDVVQTNIWKFIFSGPQGNVIDGSGLDYIRDDDTQLNVTAINVKPDNTKKSITVGDSLGEKRTLYFYDVSDDELERLATQALEKYKYEGFRGSFVTFLNPKVDHGQCVMLEDPEIPDRNGVYLVRQVVTRSGLDGGRQEITLDRKLS
jgi:hypothetical protein